MVSDSFKYVGYLNESRWAAIYHMLAPSGTVLWVSRSFYLLGAIEKRGLPGSQLRRYENCLSCRKRNLQVKGVGKDSCSGSSTAKKRAAKIALPPE